MEVGNKRWLKEKLNLHFKDVALSSEDEPLPSLAPHYSFGWFGVTFFTVNLF